MCVLMMWSDWGWSLGEVHIAIIAEGQRTEVLGALSGRRSGFAQSFSQPCVHFDFAHLVVNEISMMQGYHTLNALNLDFR